MRPFVFWVTDEMCSVSAKPAQDRHGRETVTGSCIEDLQSEPSVRDDFPLRFCFRNPPVPVWSASEKGALDGRSGGDSRPAAKNIRTLECSRAHILSVRAGDQIAREQC